jgi:hypothetical protein
VVGIVLASLQLAGRLKIDLAGIFAALVASGAAWLLLKQHAQLAAAYQAASVDLALQQDLLLATTEPDWAEAVSAAEKAISREHTMWLASRGTLTG